ncbi:uncharacterized protein LOC120259954 [Dioscorea cayenensis subsp. rotundata]|uniref:Uncharacterized protein LOC120259954 n=1 Tax=Dioscorea cayennensis subsp. rotundata TaxID=55577 RepID=A0AB40B7W2_DIOCR|nr:uncharacterized protein LOC120259954 [Dioscorea cayenensis subsp. rotundata]
MLKTLDINVPLVEAAAQIPRYAKFLKELLTNKRKLEEISTITLSEECSAIISNRIPKKEKDLGGFIISCTVGGMLDVKALTDLWANINLMPDKIFQKLALVDFGILDLDDKVEVPLILGCPFLATSQALIDVKDGQMVLRVGDEKMVFKLRDAMCHSMDDDYMCYALDIIDDCVLDFI